jgi:hypothetical protein
MLGTDAKAIPLQGDNKGSIELYEERKSKR